MDENTIFTAEIKGETLKTYINTVTALQDKVVLSFDKEGIKSIQMDPSQIALHKIELFKEDMEEYTNQKEIMVEIEEIYLKNLSGTLKKNQTIQITGSVEVNNTIQVSFINKYIKGSEDKRELEIFCEEYTTKPPKIPTIEKMCEITIDHLILKEIIADMKKIKARHINIKYKKEKGLEVESTLEGDLSTRLKYTVNPENLLKVDGNTEDQDSVYSQEYLEKIIKNTDQTKIKIHYKTDMPIKINYQQNNVNTTYWLAPRIESR